jgi:hypothetical protein
MECPEKAARVENLFFEFSDVCFELRHSDFELIRVIR